MSDMLPAMAQAQNPPKTLYVFVDESGNFDFTPAGTSHFFITGIVTFRPFAFDDPLTSLRFDLMEQGQNVERFHATNDSVDVRNRVFDAIHGVVSRFRTHTVVVNKRKANPVIRPPHIFYPMCVGYMLKYLMHGIPPSSVRDIVVIADSVPNKKGPKIEVAVKKKLPSMLPGQISYRVLHHDSRSCCGLQVADYVCWAVQRKWNKGQARYYDLIHPSIQNEFDLFRSGQTFYY